MQRFLGQIGSIGVALLVTAAGLFFDVKTLTYSGFVILALVGALWLWSWGNSAPVAEGVQSRTLDHSSPPSDLNDRERVLYMLKRARENAAIAIKMKGDDAARQVYTELVAATLSAEREFGFGKVKIKSKFTTVPWKTCLDIYIQYIDSIYALLCEGHIEAAKLKSNVFTVSYD